MTFDPQRGLSRGPIGRAAISSISRLMAEALARPDLVSLAAGFVDQATLPVEATRRGARCRLVRSGRPARRCNMEPRSATCRFARRSSLAMAAAPRRGGQAAPAGIDRGRNHRRQQPAPAPRGRYAARSGRYRALRRAELLRLHGHAGQRRRTDRSACRPMSKGIVPEALEEELARREAAGELARVKAIYVVTYYDNPTGVTTSLARRQQVTGDRASGGRNAVARRHDLRDRRRRLSRAALLRRRRVRACLLWMKANGDSRRHVLQSPIRPAFASAGASCRGSWWSRSWRRRATSISARRISTRC